MYYSKQFQQRLIVSAIALFVLLTFLHFAFLDWFRPIFVIFTGAILGTALWEFYQIVRNKGTEPNAVLGISATFLYALAVYASTQWKSAEGLPYFVLGLTLALAFLWQLFKQKSPILNITVTLLGVVYLTIPLTSLIRITYYFPEGEQDGRIWLLYLLAVTKMTDVGGYTLGKLYGKHLMAPIISPKKTWEGAIGGTLSAMIASLMFALAMSLFDHPPIIITLFQGLWMGLLISLMAQFGDMAESLIKRDAGVKDSNVLPGLGGALDIMDSLVFTAPLVYGILYLLYP